MNRFVIAAIACLAMMEINCAIDQSSNSPDIYDGNGARRTTGEVKSGVIERAIEVNLSDVRLYLCTRRNQWDEAEIDLRHFDGHINSAVFDPRRANFFVVHGAGDDRGSMLGIKDALLARRDANVFLIDYSGPAGLFYTRAVTAVAKLGPIIGEAIGKIRTRYDISFDEINLVGHSLGAHLAASIGAHFEGKVNYIVGLDPAGPLFERFAPDRRLDKGDARTVHAIHCNGGLQGMQQALAHADYFPNGGGMNQPGCGPDLLGICAHHRALLYYEEAVRSGGFRGTSCENYQRYGEGKCKGNPQSSFGQIPLDKNASGNFYFDTNAESPFAKTDER